MCLILKQDVFDILSHFKRRHIKDSSLQHRYMISMASLRDYYDIVAWLLRHRDMVTTASFLHCYIMIKSLMFQYITMAIR